MFRHALLAVLALPLAALAQLRADFDLGAQWKVNSTARLMSGLEPNVPSHVAFAQTQAWLDHSAAMQDSWNRLREGRVAAMTTWRDSAISRTCPLGKTLLYPFSGPDFFNAYWMFPDCETFVMFGLEHPGDVPDIEAMTEKQLQRLIADTRIATADLFKRNYFITDHMARHLRTPHLRGVVPLVMISMTMSGLEILRVVPKDIERLRTRQVAGEAPMREFKGVTIEFRVPGSPGVRRMHYFSLDVTNNGLRHYPEFVDYLRSLGPTTTFIKSASYLLHGGNFSVIHNTLLDVSGFIVQDDSGFPYGSLARNWEVKLYGRYGKPIPPFQRAFQVSLAREWQARQPDPLPFTFGYQYHDRRDERSHVIVARKRQGPQAALHGNGDPLARADSPR